MFTFLHVMSVPDLVALVIRRWPTKVDISMRYEHALQAHVSKLPCKKFRVMKDECSLLSAKFGKMLPVTTSEFLVGFVLTQYV